MTNAITATGLTINTLTQTIANIVAGLQGIYGTGIQTDQNSSDGQCIGIAGQAVTDLLEFIVAVNNGFDPDQAVGVILDQRVAFNNIQRQGGTYTVQPVTITCSAPVTLAGLDSNYNDPNGVAYKVQDGSGNEFLLANTTTLPSGPTALNFRAQQIGAVSVPVNTITIPVTIVPGVTSVNNNSGPITIGQTQETDPQLRTRRQQSVSLATTGYLNGLLGAIQGLTGVTEAVLYDNRHGYSVNGMVPNSIWLVVAGGSSADIANEIYGRISDGCNQNGAQTCAITTPSGSQFVAQWDQPVAETLYVKFSLQQTVANFGISLSAVQAYMAANIQYKIGQFAETSSLTLSAINAITAQGGGGVPLLMQISPDNSSWTDYLAPTGINYQFTLSASNISITLVP